MRLSLIWQQVVTNGGVNIQRYQHAESTGALVMRLSFTAWWTFCCGRSARPRDTHRVCLRAASGNRVVRQDKCSNGIMPVSRRTSPKGWATWTETLDPRAMAEPTRRLSRLIPCQSPNRPGSPSCWANPGHWAYDIFMPLCRARGQFHLFQTTRTIIPRSKGGQPSTEPDSAPAPARQSCRHRWR
jgi:hypothetical protein